MQTKGTVNRLPTANLEPTATPAQQARLKKSGVGINDASLWATAGSAAPHKGLSSNALQTGLAAQVENLNKRAQAFPAELAAEARAFAAKLTTAESGNDPKVKEAWQGLADKVAASKADVHELVQFVLMVAQTEVNKDLAFHAQKVDFFNKAKAKMREHMTKLREYEQLMREWEIENNRQTGDAWFETRTDETQNVTTEVGTRVTGTVTINTGDPLIIDLDGDGVETTRDLEGNGFLISQSDATDVDVSTQTLQSRSGNTISIIEETTTVTTDTHTEVHFQEWVGKDDGLLVLDHNQDGAIQSEDLFGDQSVTGRGAANGYEDLALLDANGDGVINKDDPMFAELRVWKDGDSDGMVDQGEMLTLEQAGVAEIRTAYEDTSDSVVRQAGTFKSTRAVELEAMMAEYTDEVRAPSDMNLEAWASGEGATFEVKGELFTSADQIGEEITKWEGKLATAGDDAQLANVDLQNMLQKQQQTLQLLSGVSKTLHDTAMSVVRKIGG